MKTIFFISEMQCMYIAVLIGEPGYLNSYKLMELDYGGSHFDDISKSDQFKVISKYDLPEAITYDHYYRTVIEERIISIHTHKIQ